MAHWPYDNLPHTDSDAVISGGAPSTTLSVSGHAAGDLLLCIVLTPSPNAPTDDGTGSWSVHADVNAQDVYDQVIGDDNKVSLFSKVAAGDETTVTISGADTDPQDGLSGMLVVCKGGNFVDDAAWAYGGASPVTSVETTATSGNTELIFLLTEAGGGANPSTTDTRVFHVASQTPNNEVEGIELYARRRGAGASGGVVFTTTVGNIRSSVAVAVSLRYPGRTIRRIDFT